MRKIQPILFLIVIGIILTAGCASDPENVSERPWNAPKNWENGMPTGMMNPR